MSKTSKPKEQIENIVARLEQAVKKFGYDVNEFRLSNNAAITKMHDITQSIQKRVHDYQKLMEKVIETNANVNESICNVLLAIRQNEYLQAWYPPQKGYPEMKVVGKHPANIKEK